MIQYPDEDDVEDRIGMTMADLDSMLRSVDLADRNDRRFYRTQWEFFRTVFFGGICCLARFSWRRTPTTKGS
jgi:hypothetical protein